MEPVLDVAPVAAKMSLSDILDQPTKWNLCSFKWVSPAPAAFTRVRVFALSTRDSTSRFPALDPPPPHFHHLRNREQIPPCPVPWWQDHGLVQEIEDASQQLLLLSHLDAETFENIQILDVGRLIEYHEIHLIKVPGSKYHGKLG